MWILWKQGLFPKADQNQAIIEDCYGEMNYVENGSYRNFCHILL